jgi:hypothetical protein
MNSLDLLKDMNQKFYIFRNAKFKNLKEEIVIATEILSFKNGGDL